MADEIDFGPQANFNILATEILKIPNTPALAGGQQLLDELRALMAQLTGDTRAIRQDIANVRQQVIDVRQELITTITASNHNNAARVQNTYLRSQNENLVPFLDATTGAAVLHFPHTTFEIERMARRQLDSVLQQLGIPTQGANLAEKKRLLRAHIGLPEVAGSPPP
ncbi:hypothetical protein A1O7_03636 [Cladophialophora yegresii CBS 114405]|uniref:Uncharacterized protein n=1 Tax=Cladophialophora yegresii CBS 114405 TaxID=1182544 RepID=W9WDW7_9EURO|nr:uncharacterized protein A1O7_03636 [Cladophialophora yegresii CBS 114405]EXJ63190.1 hypothetical protein A1O7_03636 [Cladophialophora yegresii CBS 114405]